jgi:hypothetical protein
LRQVGAAMSSAELLALAMTTSVEDAAARPGAAGPD